MITRRIFMLAALAAAAVKALWPWGAGSEAVAGGVDGEDDEGIFVLRSTMSEAEAVRFGKAAGHTDEKCRFLFAGLDWGDGYARAVFAPYPADGFSVQLVREPNETPLGKPITVKPFKASPRVDELITRCVVQVLPDVPEQRFLGWPVPDNWMELKAQWEREHFAYIVEQGADGAIRRRERGILCG